MPQYSRRIFKYDFTLTAGTATTNQALNPDDLSNAQCLRIELSLTSIGTDAIDTLDVKLQTTRDGTIFDTRVRFNAVAGTTAAPRQYVANLYQQQPLASGEEVYELTGSTGTEIAAGTVVHGPFPGRRRNAAAAGGGMASAWRVSLVQTDADSDATFIGTITIRATSSYAE